MEPFTKSFNDTYLDYIKGKPIPKPVTPPEISDGDESVGSYTCDHPGHNHNPQDQFDDDELDEFGNKRYKVHSKTRPRVENVKSTLEVPPISGLDYENPHWSAMHEEGVINAASTFTGAGANRGGIDPNTGLPYTTAGHDSQLLANSRNDGDGFIPFHDGSGNVYSLTDNKSQILHQNDNELPDHIDLGTNLYNDASYDSTFIILFGELALRYQMSQVRVEKYNIIENLSAHEPSYVQINQDKMFICGGVQRGTKQTISDQVAVFDFQIQSFSNLPSMIVPKYHHS